MGTKEELRNIQKQKRFAEWMKGDHVMLHLDARREGVQLPEHLMNNPSVTLKLSYNFQGSTTIDDRQITSYLRFGGVYHECVIPWSAVWGITASTDENQIWPEDLSRELLLQLATNRIKEIGGRLLGRKEKSEPETQTAIDAGPEPKPKADQDQDKIGTGGKVHPFLRRVK